MSYQRPIHHRFRWDIAKVAAAFLTVSGFLFAATAATTNSISPGQIIPGSITPLNTTNFYSFAGSSNDVVWLTLVNTNGPGNPTLWVYDPMGDEVSHSCGDGVRTYYAGLRLLQTGTYTVLISDCDNLNRSYDYLVGFSKLAGGVNQREPGDGPEALVPGLGTSGHLAVADLDIFTFTATSNDAVWLTLVNTNGPGNPTLWIYDPAGDEVSHSCGDGIRTYYAGLGLLKTGTYTVLISDCGNLNRSYDYIICMIKILGPNFPEPGEGQELLVPNETRGASITVGDLDAFRFYAIAGDTVTLTLQKTSGSGLNPVMDLYFSDGSLLTTASAASSVRIRISCVSQTTGDYYVIIRDDGLNEAFGYSLTLIQYPVVPPSSGTTQYLAIFQCTNHVVVRWETNSVGFVLESSERPCSTPSEPVNVWSPVNTVPQVIADHFYVDVGAVTNGNKFYRLRK